MAAATPLQQLLSLLLLLLPSPLRQHLSAGDNNHVGGGGGGGGGGGVNPGLHPIFLVPGMSCSDLEARLTDAYRPASAPHCGAMKGKGWFRLWNNVSDLQDHDYVQCFQEQMSLVYDPATNDYRNLPGVETRVPNFGSTRAFSFKNPDKSDWCLGKLRAALENKGYRDRDTMFGAPYDFRYAPPCPGQTSDVYSGYFKDFMELVEAAAERTQKRAVILGHSFGGAVALEFVRSTPQRWRNRHIERLILVAPALATGFMEPVSNVASGTDILFVPATTPLSMRATWRSFESAIVNFPSPAVFGRQALVVTGERNYSAHEMDAFLADVGFGDAVEPFMRRAVPKMTSLAAPMVPTTCISGVGVRTPLRLVFRDDNGGFDASPEVGEFSDGDGKINSISVLAFEDEMRRQVGQREQFRSVKIDNAQHSTIVTDDFALDRVMQEIFEINNP